MAVKAYEKPSVKFWSAEQLNAIEAKMSIGGSGGGLVLPVCAYKSNPVFEDHEYLAYASGYYYPNIDSPRVYFEGRHQFRKVLGLQAGWERPAVAFGKYHYYFAVAAVCEGAFASDGTDVGVTFADVIGDLSFFVSLSSTEATINENDVEFYASPPLPGDVSAKNLVRLDRMGYLTDLLLANMPVPSLASSFGSYMLSSYGYTLGQLSTRGWFITHPRSIDYEPPWQMYSCYPYVSGGLLFEVSAPVDCEVSLAISVWSGGSSDGAVRTSMSIGMDGKGNVRVRS